MRLLKFASILLALTSVAYANVRQPEGGIGDQILVGWHEDTDSEIYVVPLAIVEDSRCPIEINCVQEGRLTVRVRVESSLGIEEHTIGLQSPIGAAGGLLRMRSATARSLEKHEPYRFLFDFSPMGEVY